MTTINPNTQPEVPSVFSLQERPVCQTLLKALILSRSATQVDSTVLPGTTAKSYAAAHEDLKPY